MNIGDKCYCMKTGKTVKVQGTRMATIGDRQVMKVMTNRGERFYDELMVLKPKSDTWLGRLLGM